MSLRWLLFSCLLGYSLCEQQILQNTVNKDGILRRFEVESLADVLSVAEEYNLDIWHTTDKFVDIYSPPDEPLLPEELVGMPHTVTSIPTRIPIARRLQADWEAQSLTNSSFHDHYHPLDEVHSFLKQLSGTHSNAMQLRTIGQSAEGKDIFALSISSGDYPDKDDTGKKKKKKKGKRAVPHSGEKMGFVIVGAQHAREWVATATSIYLAHALVANRSESHSMSNLLAHFDFHIVPVPNPDGYAYTWEEDRYWYKNRQIIGPYEKCVGVDMNRNWGFKWKAHAIDRGLWQKDDTKPRQPTNPCSHWYPGTRPFEAPEVNNLANWVATLPNVVGFIDLRSYGQMLSSPYSYTCNRLPKDAEDQIEAAFGASHALNSVHGTYFRAGALCSMLYAAPGNIVDWMYAREAIKYSYVAHLRDTGTYGFSLPEKWIRPTGEETASLVEYLAKFIAKQAKREF